MLCSKRDEHQLRSAVFWCQSNWKICLSWKEQQYNLPVIILEGIQILLGPWGSRPLLGPEWLLDFFGFISIVFSLASPFCPSSVNSLEISVSALLFLEGRKFAFSHFFVIEKIAPISKPLGNIRTSRNTELNVYHNNLGLSRQGCYSTSSYLWV